MIYKKIYVAVFLTREHNAFSILRKKRFKADSKTVQFKKGKSYVVDVSQYTHSRGLRFYYFIDIGAGQLFFKGNKKNIVNPETADMILRQGIIKQITANLGAGFNAGLMNMVMAFLIGGLIGFVIAGFI